MTPASPPEWPARPGPYLTFHLGEDCFAVHLDDVLSVLENAAVEPYPYAAAPICGTVHRQGQPVPVVDLRALLGLPPEGSPWRPVLVVTRPSYGGPEQTALAVDGVLEVLDLGGEEIELRPTEQTSLPMVNGAAEGPRGRVLLLDTDRLHELPTPVAVLTLG